MVTQELLDSIRERLDAGESAWAIEQLRALIKKEPAAPDVHRLLALAYLKQGDHEAAIASMSDARAIETTSNTELGFGRFLNRKGYKEAALNCLLAAVELDAENADALALICQLSAELGQLELGLPYGQRSLEARDRAASRQLIFGVGRQRPKRFDPQAPNENIIAFSLFGDNRYYWESAIGVASMAWALFPEWRCRFYCDPNVPLAVRQTLLRLRSQIFISPRNSQKWGGQLWRFYAFDDPNVNVVMVRDVDSPFTLRERAAVDEWLASDRPFHVIRDHANHSEPMMAGLWGGWTKLLPPLQPLIQQHTATSRDRYADQEFLRLQIWPRIRWATFTHDRHFTLGETHRLAGTAADDPTHIGMAWPRYPATTPTAAPTIAPGVARNGAGGHWPQPKQVAGG